VTLKLKMQVSSIVLKKIQVVLISYIFLSQKSKTTEILENKTKTKYR